MKIYTHLLGIVSKFHVLHLTNLSKLINFCSPWNHHKIIIWFSDDFKGKKLIEGWVMQIEKAMINDCFEVFENYPENFVFQLLIILQ